MRIESLDRANKLATLLTLVSRAEVLALPHDPTALDVYVHWAMQATPSYIWYAPVRQATLELLRLHVYPRMLRNGTAPLRVPQLMDLLAMFMPYFPKLTLPAQQQDMQMALELSDRWLLLLRMLCEVLAQTMTPQQTPIQLGADAFEPHASNLSIGVHLCTKC